MLQVNMVYTNEVIDKYPFAVSFRIIQVVFGQPVANFAWSFNELLNAHTIFTDSQYYDGYPANFWRSIKISYIYSIVFLFLISGIASCIFRP